jgi:hypothetical protein
MINKEADGECLRSNLNLGCEMATLSETKLNKELLVRSLHFVR